MRGRSSRENDKHFTERLPGIAFVLALMILSVAYGYWSHRAGVFPHSWVVAAEEGWNLLRERSEERLPWYRFQTDRIERMNVIDPDAVQPGLTLVAGIDGDDLPFAEVIDESGGTVHRWSLDWFTIWPDADHLHDDVRPKSNPGTIVHGVLLLENGDLVFNYEALGMVRLDPAGNVVWRLPAMTHHSLHLDERGHIWSSVRYRHREPGEADFPGYFPPYFEETIVEIAPETGEILREISVFELLRETNLHGLMYLATASGEVVHMTNDPLHLNDVEPFPAGMEPGHFEPGDIMISLRQANAVVVFHLPTRELKYLSMGSFVRQHDPDFIDGDTISIYDNNHVATREQGTQSRILLERAPDRQIDIAFEGTEQEPFFSSALGKHQWLENGNLLVLESTAGRLIEVDGEGRLVADFVNLAGNGLASVLSEGSRLPEHFDRAFFEEARRSAKQLD